jgi:hypothetical protein
MVDTFALFKMGENVINLKITALRKLYKNGIW